MFMSGKYLCEYCYPNSSLQKEYILAKPSRDAAAKAKMEAGETLEPESIHEDNEWNIR